MQRLLLAIVVLAQLVTPQDSGTISGRLLTPLGNPIKGARVAAAIADPAAGVLDFTLASLAQTDADGKYTLENVPPGKYVLTAGSVNAPIFFPNGPRDSATVISVSAGARIVGIDFKGNLFTDAIIAKSLPSTMNLRNIPVAGLSMPANSAFVITAPLPGIYTAVAPSLSPPSPSPTWIAAPFANEVSLRAVSGRVELEPGATPATFSLNVLGLFGMQRRGVSPDTLAGLQRLANPLRDSLFATWGIYDPLLLSVDVKPASREAFRFLLPEGSYAVLDTLSAGGANGNVFVKSATYGSTDVLSSPLVIKGATPSELRIVLGVKR